MRYIQSPTGDEMDSVVSTVSGWVIEYAIPALVGLLVLGLVIAILTRFAFRAVGISGLGPSDYLYQERDHDMWGDDLDEWGR